MPPGGAIEEGSLLKAVMDDVCEKRARTCRPGAMLGCKYVRQGYYLCMCLRARNAGTGHSMSRRFPRGFPAYICVLIPNTIWETEFGKIEFARG